MTALDAPSRPPFGDVLSSMRRVMMSSHLVGGFSPAITEMV